MMVMTSSSNTRGKVELIKMKAISKRTALNDEVEEEIEMQNDENSVLGTEAMLATDDATLAEIGSKVASGTRTEVIGTIMKTRGNGEAIESLVETTNHQRGMARENGEGIEEEEEQELLETTGICRGIMTKCNNTPAF